MLKIREIEMIFEGTPTHWVDVGFKVNNYFSTGKRILKSILLNSFLL